MDYYSFTNPTGWKAELTDPDSLPTKWSSVNRGSGAEQGKSVEQTDVLTTNLCCKL